MKDSSVSSLSKTSVSTKDSFQVTVVVDNCAAAGLAAEHGFALWLKAPGRTILFDTGNGDSLQNNLKVLELETKQLTDVVLSHGHYDHSGNIGLIIKEAPQAQLHLHQAALLPRYARDGESLRPVRMPARSMQVFNGQHDRTVHWLTGPVKLTPAVGLTGPIPRLSGFEDTGGEFFLDPAAKKPDLIEDDNALWFHTSVGLVVCAGCSHAGIVNTLQRVIAVSGEQRIHMVIGGLHLLNASESRLQQTVSELNRLKLDHLVGCHCTGEIALGFLKSNLRAEVRQGYAGLSLSF